MAKQEDVAKLKVEQLKQLAAAHDLKVTEGAKKDELVKTVAAGITPEDLEAYNAAQEGDGKVDDGKRDGGDNAPDENATTGEANEGDAGDRIQPPVAAEGLGAAATDEAYDENNQVTPSAAPADVKAAEHEATAAKVETRKAEAKGVATDLGTSEEEAAAERAGVPEERLHDPKQNREPKNEFEKSNQKVTEEERVAAQKVSDMSTSDRVENAPAPVDSAQTDAAKTAETNQGADIAQAIAEGFKQSKDDHFTLKADEGVDPRFSLVKNKDGKVLVRENETGHLSEIQLKSIEEKEASIQDQEVEEL